MFRRLFYIALILFTCQPIVCFSQKTLKEIDHIKNDSTAISEYESYITKGTLSVKEKAEILLRISSRACISRNFAKGIQSANDGIILVQKNNLDSLNGALHKMLGITYYFMEQRKKAIEYFEKAISIAHLTNDWFTEATSHNNIGAALIELKEYEAAESHLITSITIMKQQNKEDDSSVGLTYRLLASLYNTLKKPEKAEPIYLKFIEKSRKDQDTTLLCSNLIYYSDLLTARGDFKNALLMSGEALSYLRTGHNTSDLLAAMQFHAKNMLASGKTKEAYELQCETYKLLKKSFNKDLEKEISELDVKYKTEQLKRDKQTAEENTKKQQWIYLIVFSGILIVSVFMIYIFNQRKNTKIKIASQQQRLEAIIEGEEKERGRIAKDLHDGIVQNLTAIKLKVQTVEETTDFLKGIIHDIDEASKEVRNISYQMMPIALREYGLIKSLEDLLQRTLIQKNIQYEFESVHINERLSDKIEVCLYRITQELLNNVIKHSKANFVSLVISKHQNFVSLVFEDNGQGFNTEEVKKGIGMTSLSSRLEIVNGQLKFESSSGSGTMAIIKIPFQ